MEKERLYFWSTYTDKQILEAIQQRIYKQYGFNRNVTPQIDDEFLNYIYYATHVLEFLIDEGWDEFEKSIWNTPVFFNAIGQFNGRFLNSIKERIAEHDSDSDDHVQEYVIDTQIRLQENISEAMRLHQAKFDAMLPELEELIAKNNERRDNIYIEKWKQED